MGALTLIPTLDSQQIEISSLTPSIADIPIQAPWLIEATAIPEVGPQPLDTNVANLRQSSRLKQKPLVGDLSFFWCGFEGNVLILL